MTKSKLLRMDNTGIVVESLDGAISFFTELGMILEGRATIEGEWAGRVTGLGSQRIEIAMMVTPDGHSRLEISRFLNPPVLQITAVRLRIRSATCGLCSPLTISTSCSRDFTSMALHLLAKWFRTGLLPAMPHLRTRRTSHRARRTTS